jgi:uncharacterized hydrophobic protein (TIGR00271 family)
MVRQVIVRIPLDQDEVDEMYGLIRKIKEVRKAVRRDDIEDAVFTLYAQDNKVRVLMAKLVALGVGDKFGSIDVVQLVTTVPMLDQIKRDHEKKKREYRVDDRMTVEEIYAIIDSQNHLTFDYIIMLFVASCIAAAGLVGDSSTIVVSSMLVSPLMGPILGITFGIAARIPALCYRGIRNEAVGFAICFLVGFIGGFCIAPFYNNGGVEEGWASGTLRSDEIESRGSWWGLVLGIFVAAPSGMAMVLVTTGGGINALVGVAISASLLPPIVNVGLCLALGIFYSAGGHDKAGHDFLEYSAASFCLFLINIALIVLCGFCMFKIKNVNSLDLERSQVLTHGFNQREVNLAKTFLNDVMADGDEEEGKGVSDAGDNKEYFLMEAVSDTTPNEERASLVTNFMKRPSVETFGELSI